MDLHRDDVEFEGRHSLDIGGRLSPSLTMFCYRHLLTHSFQILAYYLRRYIIIFFYLIFVGILY